MGLISRPHFLSISLITYNQNTFDWWMCIVCCHFQLNWNVYVNFDILKGKIKRQSKNVVMVSTHSCMRHHVSHIYKLWMWMGWKQSVKHLSNEMLWNEKATAAKNLINRMKVFFYFIRIKESSHIFFISCLFSVFFIFFEKLPEASENDKR